jgi:uncharacterized RmlC-like cupin family protein
MGETAADQALRIVRAGDRRPDLASGAMVREAAISEALVGAEKIWVGYVELPPGARSAPHHHGDCESAIYVISGEARFLFGRDYATVDTARPGEFVWVPPWVPHIEENASETQPVRMVVVRSTQETLVFNLAE